MTSPFIPREKIRDSRPWSPQAFVERRKGDRRGTAHAPESPDPASTAAEQATPASPAVDNTPRFDVEAERRQIAEEREAVLAQARDEGFLAGLADGRKSARGEIARLAQLIQSFDAALAEEQPRVAEALVELAIDVARAVVRRELAQDRTAIMAAVEDALRAVPESVNGGEILVHPDDATLVRERLVALDESGAWRIVPTPGVDAGGCRVVTRVCEIDARLRTRWRRALQSFGRDDEARHPFAEPADG